MLFWLNEHGSGPFVSIARNIKWQVRRATSDATMFSAVYNFVPSFSGVLEA
jgi:hypothetical protein